MKALRRLGFALWLALALVAGQQLALLHDFGHAAESLAQDHDSKPGPAKCDQHYATCQLVGAASEGIAVPLAGGEAIAAAAIAVSTHAAHFTGYRSRAPPALL